MRNALVMAALSLIFAVAAAPASAQTVLERVLDQIGGATQVSGIFANTADSIGVPERTLTETVPNERELVRTLEAGDEILVNFEGDEFLVTVGTDGRLTRISDGEQITVSGVAGIPLFEGPGGVLTVHPGNFIGGSFANVSGFPEDFSFATTTTSDPTLSVGDVILVNTGADEFLVVVGPDDLLFFAEDVPGADAGFFYLEEEAFGIGTSLFEGPGGVLTVDPDNILDPGFVEVSGFDDFVALQATREIVTTIPGRSLTIDASITTTITGVAAEAATFGDVSVTEPVTALIGNLSTTALGAVNTGEIGLGTNQVVEEALSGVSEATRLTVQQIGTQTGETVLALNSALNTANIDGSISNTFEGVNASVAAISPDQFEITAAGNLTAEGISELMGSVETTVIGAVNTGTIISGVNNQVQGTVASIVGNSATNAFE